MRKLLLKLIFFVSFVLTTSISQAQLGKKAIKEGTSKWYDNVVLLNGQQLKLHSSVNRKELDRQYRSNKIWWDKAFEFIKENDLNELEPGSYPIDGENVFAIVTEGPGKDFEQGKWESHRHYNDIQYIIKGKEKMGIALFTSLSVTEPYDNSKDIAFYIGSGKYYIGRPNVFFIFSPEYAHRPGIRVNGVEPIKKIVIKVRTGK